MPYLTLKILENMPLILVFDLKSVLFRAVRTSQFFDTWFSNSELYSIDITQYAFAGCRTNTKCRNHRISPKISWQYLHLVGKSDFSSIT